MSGPDAAGAAARPARAAWDLEAAEQLRRGQGAEAQRCAEDGAARDVRQLLRIDRLARHRGPS